MLASIWKGINPLHRRWFVQVRVCRQVTRSLSGGKRINKRVCAGTLRTRIRCRKSTFGLGLVLFSLWLVRFFLIEGGWRGRYRFFQSSFNRADTLSRPAEKFLRSFANQQRFVWLIRENKRAAEDPWKYKETVFSRYAYTRVIGFRFFRNL